MHSKEERVRKRGEEKRVCTLRRRNNPQTRKENHSTQKALNSKRGAIHRESSYSFADQNRNPTYNSSETLRHKILD